MARKQNISALEFQSKRVQYKLLEFLLIMELSPPRPLLGWSIGPNSIMAMHLDLLGMTISIVMLVLVAPARTVAGTRARTKRANSIEVENNPQP